MKQEECDGVSASACVSRQKLVFAYYVTGHGFGHATRVAEVALILNLLFLSFLALWVLKLESLWVG